MYNATNAATWLWAPQRFATRLRVLRRASIQRKDLFVTFRVSTRRYSARLGTTQRRAPQRNATICLLQRNSALRRSSPLGSAFGSAPQRNDLFVTPRRNVAYSIAALFCSTQRFVCYFASLGAAALLDFPQRYALLLNDLFVNLLPRLDTALGNEPRRNSACRDAQQLNATICLSIYSSHLRAPPLNATCLGAVRRTSPQRNSTQRTET